MANDSPNHIPAVCIKEDPELCSISVLLAVNKDKPGDGSGVLQEIKQGLEKICTILSQVSERMFVRSSHLSIANQLHRSG